MVAGCSNSKFRRTPQPSAKTPWFCEMNETHDDWDCVQDAELAKHPKPKRLPGDEPELPGAVPTIVPTVSVMGDSDSGREPES
jgi:hypothetical protein